MAPNFDLAPDEIERRIVLAVDALLAHDCYLLTSDSNERSITHKFAEHLQGEFPDWDVDCEYNRDRHDPKRLELPPRQNISSDDLNAKTVFPDIIVHQRGTDVNLAVIEVKKSTNNDGDAWDLLKLTAFKSQLGYRVALHFKFQTGESGPAFEWRRVNAEES